MTETQMETNRETDNPGKCNDEKEKAVEGKNHADGGSEGMKRHLI